MESTLRPHVEELIYVIDVDAKSSGNRFGFHLDYEQQIYRQNALVGLIRDTVEYFALSHQEFKDIYESGDLRELKKRAWGRISAARRDKKGDYGELLLFLLLRFRMKQKPERFVTKVRLRSSRKEQIKGFDCAHFTIENDEPCLWLGEAKFHESIHTAVPSAFKSLNEHLSTKYLKDELIILGANIEANHNVSKSYIEKLDRLLNKGRSLDKINIRIPILLTYDSSAVKKHTKDDDLFISDIKSELNSYLDSAEKRNTMFPENCKLIFLIMPFYSVSKIKEKLEKIEEAMQ